MPSFSRATSRIGRFVAACEISMSDFGLTCCEAGIGAIRQMQAITTGWPELQANLVPDGEIGGRGEFAGVELLAVGGLHARDLEAAVGANHGEAVGFDLDDLAHLAGDALGVFRRQRLGVEDLQLLAVERRPRAGRRIAAADQVVDLLARACPSRCARCRGRSGPRRSPSTSSCLMRGALPAFTRSTASSMASTPIGNSRSK